MNHQHLIVGILAVTLGNIVSHAIVSAWHAWRWKQRERAAALARIEEAAAMEHAEATVTAIIRKRAVN